MNGLPPAWQKFKCRPGFHCGLSNATPPHFIEMRSEPFAIFEFSTRLQIGDNDLTQNPYEIEFYSTWGFNQANWIPILFSVLVVLFVYVFILYLLQTIRHYTETLRINEQRFYQYFKTHMKPLS